MSLPSSMFFFFFFTDTATTELYTLSLHDALPIWDGRGESRPRSERWSCPAYDRRWPSVLLKFAEGTVAPCAAAHKARACGDRKSTRLNSSHVSISYAVFCLKKKTRKGCVITFNST